MISEPMSLRKDEAAKMRIVFFACSEFSAASMAGLGSESIR